MKIDEKIFNEIWSDLKKDNIKFINNPKAFVLGGQPGAGKSKLIKKALDILEQNAIIINGDDYRKYHPDYVTLQNAYGKDSPKYTALFAGIITEMILEKAIKEKINVIIEGTFRTATTPIKTLKLFKDNGYSTNVLIQTCNKELSYKSCLERYEKMCQVMPNEARFTDKAHHDLVVSCLADNIKEVYDSNLVDNMKIYIRTNNSYEELKITNSTFDVKLLNKYIG